MAIYRPYSELYQPYLKPLSNGDSYRKFDEISSNGKSVTNIPEKKTFTNLLEKCQGICKKPGIYSAAKMMACGFEYTGTGDTAKCNECQLKVSSWTSTMEPFSIHAARSPHCVFVKKMRQFNDCFKSLSTSSDSKSESIVKTNEKIILESIAECETLRKARHRNFSHWPHRQSPSQNEMIQAGFFCCNVSDRVICIYCNLICQKWVPYVDNPVEIHKRLSPKCKYVEKLLAQQNVKVLPIINENHGNDSANTTNIHTYQLNEIVYANACHSQYNEIPRRHASFINWPADCAQSVDDLVQAGFFYAGTKTVVTCFYCGGSLQNWGKNDKPLIEHVRWFPRCQYAKQLCDETLYRRVQESKRVQKENSNQNDPTKSSNNLKFIVNDQNTLSRYVAARLDLPISQKLLKQGFKLSVIKRCWEDQLRIKHDDFTEEIDLYLACVILGKQIQYIDGKKENIIVPSAQLETIREASAVPSTISSDAEMVSVSQPSTAESSTNSTSTIPDSTNGSDNGSPRTCVLCLTEEKRLACIPCGHVATCVACGHSLRTCPICRQPINAFVRVYL